MSILHEKLHQSSANPEDCGCGPTAAESQELWPGIAALKQTRISRRTAIAAGAVGVVALSAFGVAASGHPAFAADYPSWDDVKRARANESAKKAQIAKLEELLKGLADAVEAANRVAQKAAEELYVAQQEFFEAADRAVLIQEQADEQAALADAAAIKAGQVANQLYRNGGDNASLELFLSGSAANADQLLARLGYMDKLLQSNQTIHELAVSSRNAAQQLSDQAVVARDERDRLQQIAEQKLVVAQDAADKAQAALDEQEARRDTLETQLAALRDKTAKTLAAYEAGVKERARLAEIARKLEEERLKAEGGGVIGTTVSAAGWARPHGGRLESGYGPRTPYCANGRCSSSNHRGIDLVNGCGAFIFAAADGTVDAVIANYSGYGNWIRIQHGGGVSTSYAHIRPNGFLVLNGSVVKAGQIIAYAGNTGNSFGCHLHFEVYLNGVTTNPTPFLRARGVTV
jgi:murein DD-endopeptidase MepM/ murein hydrolase activator NlpD